MPRVIEAFEQFFDGEGDPLVEGYIKFTVSGTNLTDKDTFADAAETIPNTNPLPLDGEGRIPDCFGSGSYRATLYTSDGQQVSQKDPVPGGDSSTAQWNEWSAAVSYSINWYLYDDNGNVYRSLQNNNENNEPSTSPTFWERLDFVQVYNANIAYTINSIILYTDGFLYITPTGTSAGETPSTDPAKWDRTSPNPDIYSATSNYDQYATIIGSDGEWYKCSVDNGPGTITGAVNPVGDNTGIWKSFSKAVQSEVNWIIASQIGNDLNIPTVGANAITALDGFNIAYIDTTNEDLRTYEFDGTDWSQVGNDLNIPGIGNPSITALNSTTIAFIDDLLNDLRTYEFDGTDWSQVGNDLNISGIGSPSITALNSTTIAFADNANNNLKTYEFDGTDWSQVGNTLSLTSIGVPALATLNSSDIAFTDTVNDELRTYRFDGINWSQIGNNFSLVAIANPALTSLNNTDIVFIDETNKELRTYRFDGTDWIKIGNSLSITNADNPSVTALNGSDISYFDETNEDLRTYRFAYYIGDGPHILQ